METRELTKFVFELGHMRRIKHEGWRLAGVTNPESVAEHSLRAAQLGFLLAIMERYENPFEVVTMLVFHDVGEIRTGDIHKLANRYITTDEERAVREQTGTLGEIGVAIFSMWQEVEQKETVAGKIAFDADKLEQAFMAKELIELGYTQCIDWIDAVGRLVQTDSARTLIEDLKTSSAFDWWHGLKKY